MRGSIRKLVLRNFVEKKLLFGGGCFQLNIPMAWARHFQLRKGQKVVLELKETGFFVKVKDDKNEDW